ncbi:aldo/keto reductase [Candidatus Bathyarchaeota archaeon]|nr:aldo/keto reductase [Candidatus Bathyarchaeota archaeon]
MVILLYRSLGKFGIEVSRIGLGVEHLKGLKRSEVYKIVKTALANGINFFDMVWDLPEITSGISDAVKEKDVKFQIHLGSGSMDGKYLCTRERSECEFYFNSTLNNLGQRSIDIVNLHYIKNLKVWKEIQKKRLIDLALDIKDEGKAKAIGVSTHSSDVVKIAVETGDIDVITYQINLANHGMPGRNEALEICNDYNVGVIAMKPFAGGNLLKTGKTVRIASYQTGGRSQLFKIPLDNSPVKCLSYVLDQTRVSTAIVGFSDILEISQAIKYFTADKEELDYSKILKKLHFQ